MKKYQWFIKSSLCFIMALLMVAGGMLSVSATVYNLPYNTKVTDTLNTMLSASKNDTQRVMIWLRDVDTASAVQTAWSSISTQNTAERLLYLTSAETLTKSESQELDNFIKQKRAAKRSVYEKYTLTFCKQYLEDSEILYASTYTPTILAELTYSRIRQLTANCQIAKMDYYNDDMLIKDKAASVRTQTVTSNHYSTASQVAYINADDAHTQFAATGANINIGIIDNYLPKPDLGVEYTPHYPYMEFSSNDLHSTYILEIIHAVAPNANFFCASNVTGTSASVTLTSEMEWFIDCGVDIVTICMHVALPTSSGTFQTDPENSYQAVAEYLDTLIYGYDLSVVHASGNSGSSGIASGAMTYNGITVGNYDRYAGIIDSTSSFSNNNRKPDLSAPGSFTLSYDGSSTGGTSFSAPVVAGTIALMMSIRQALRVNPTAVKSILTASVSLSTSHHYVPTDSEYQYYGAGIVDAYRAVYIAANNLWSSDWMDPEDLQYQTNMSVNAGETARVSMVFEKVSFSEEVSLADMDFVILDDNGIVIDSSEITHNNVEIVEFLAPHSGTYIVVVNNKANATNSTTGTEYSSIFSVSWIAE